MWYLPGVRPFGHLLSPLLVASLLCASVQLPSTASAASIASSASGLNAATQLEGDDQAALNEARILYKEGKIKFETADYEEALGLWKRAYGLLPDTQEAHVVRHTLVYNISEAQVKAYEVNRNPTHLRKAKALLERYVGEHRSLYGDTDKAVKERAEVRDRLGEVEKMIAESESRGEEAAPMAGGAATTDSAPVAGSNADLAAENAPIDPNLSPKAYRAEQIKRDPELAAAWKKSRGRIIGGSILLGGGALFALGAFSLLGTWAASRNAGFGNAGLYFSPGVYGVGAIFTGVVAIGLIVPGAVLLSSGVKQRKTLMKPAQQAYLLPYATPTSGGLAGGFRF